MTRPSTRPRRSVRSELLFLAAMFSMPAALSALFPYSAVAFASRPEARRSDPSCAFVELSVEVETKAMDRVRAALSVRRDRVGGLKADLSLSTLPEEPARAIVIMPSDIILPALPKKTKTAISSIPHERILDTGGSDSGEVLKRPKRRPC